LANAAPPYLDKELSNYITTIRQARQDLFRVMAGGPKRTGNDFCGLCIGMNQRFLRLEKAAALW
jgi:hypothetical protein